MHGTRRLWSTAHSEAPAVVAPDRERASSTEFKRQQERHENRAHPSPEAVGAHLP